MLYCNRSKRKSAANRQGATTVEFSIVATLFFFLLMSIFEFGWLNVIRHTADNAAYEAARIAIVPGATAADARREAERMLGMVGARGATITINPATLNEDSNEVEVSIAIPTNQNGIIATKILRNVTFRASSKLLTERVRQ